MADFVLQIAKKIPPPVREIIIKKNYIETAVNVFETGTPMEFLFDVYEEYIDISGEHDDFTCGQCRAHILNQFKKMLPYLIKMNIDGIQTAKNIIG